MSELTPLISDLALILICAGVMTLLFKKLKQPLVLGYIVAGFVCSPHFTFTPSVVDSANINTWSEIGVIFLLFALGLEFSFKKLMKVGGSAIMSACTIIFCMIMVGIFTGWLFDWKRMDCLFLGGMLAMSSTTIIYKAFDDMGLRQQRFAGLVLSILILEDILAIVLMVILSTLAVSQNFEGGEMVYSILKLVFFLTLWFVVGIYLIPLFLKKVRPLMSNETLLIVSLAMCFGMVYGAASVGFSPAFGAFVMGSILSETLDSEHIEKLVSPVKDLFGAIFFVSVGMMVDPTMIVEYRYPIIALVIAVILGQTIFGTLGVLLSGQPLKIAMQSGFSLTQIGEFAFIIASLGVSLHVTSNFLYPIVVAVSVITTFITPYMIRLAVPTYNIIDKYMPERWRRLLDRYSSGTSSVNHENNWKKLVSAILRIVLIFSVVSIAITILCQFKALWSDSRFNRAPLIFIILLRVAIAIVFVMTIIENLFQASAAIIVGVAILAVFGMIASRFLKKQSIVIERTFVQNLRSKDMRQEYLGEKAPQYAGKLVDRDLHLSDFKIPADSSWAGKTLKELDLSRKYGVMISSIIRGTHRVNIPDGSSRVFPDDTIQAIGSDEQLSVFADQVDKAVISYADEDFEKREMKLTQFIITPKSSFVGKTIISTSIRNSYHCLVVGVEADGDDKLSKPDVNRPFAPNDVVWIVGEEDNLSKLFAAIE